MDRKPVSSSNIVSIGYLEEKELLEVEFPNGVYQYAEVPKSVYEALMNSASVGSYFHANIKNMFTTTRV